MIVSKPALRRTLGSDLKRVDAHVIQPEEYEELPELTDEMLAKVKSAFETGDSCELSRHGDQVLVLREAVLDYLTHIGRGELSDTRMRSAGAPGATLAPDASAGVAERPRLTRPARTSMSGLVKQRPVNRASRRSFQGALFTARRVHEIPRSDVE